MAQYLSPINIETKSLIEVHKMSPLNYEGLFDTRKLTSVKNDGAKVYVKVGGDSYLSGGPLKGRYTFQGMHFHWGLYDNDGSEHAIDGEKYSLEAHFVFLRTGLEPNLNPKVMKTDHEFEDEGMSYELIEGELGEEGIEEEEEEKEEWEDEIGSICAVALLFQVTFSNRFYNIFTYLDRITEPNTGVILDGNVLTDFKDALKEHDFYTYIGSLTSPPYKNDVKWIIYKDVMPIFREQLYLLRLLKDAKGNLMDKNWMELQKVHRRPIFYPCIDSPPEFEDFGGEEDEIIEDSESEEAIIGVLEYDKVSKIPSKPLSAKTL